jgi:hypothetical protein
VDFDSGITASGRRLRIFSVVDSYTRECLALEIGTSLPSRRLTRALGEIIGRRGAPVVIRSGNVLELSSRHSWRGASSGRSTRFTFSRQADAECSRRELSWPASR